MPDVREDVCKFERVETVDEPPAPAPVDISDRRLAITVIVTGVVSLFALDALEPAPHHPDSSWVWLAEILSTAFFVLAGTGAYAALNGRARLGFGALMAAAWVQVGLVVGCPLSGHHRFGGWWAGQMALALAFAAVATVAYAIKRSAPAPRRADV